MISVIVPAHDEEALIETCLHGLSEGARPGELEVIVVCNGCTDGTEALARAFGPPVRVLSLATASKTRALDRGDAEARGFPRFYVDADVRLDVDAIRRVARVLEDGRTLAAAPRATVDASDASPLVRAFYRVWTELPYFDDAMIGSGVYALSEEGRRRFERFPDVIADDEFIRRCFAPGERRRVEGCGFTIRPPSRIVGVVRDKTRSRLGLYELRELYPPSARGAGAARRFGRALRAALARPRIWPSVPVYVLVALIVRLRARRRAARPKGDGPGHWERDPSSRPRRAVVPPSRAAVEPPARRGAGRRR